MAPTLPEDRDGDRRSWRQADRTETFALPHGFPAEHLTRDIQGVSSFLAAAATGYQNRGFEQQKCILSRSRGVADRDPVPVTLPPKALGEGPSWPVPAPRGARPSRAWVSRPAALIPLPLRSRGLSRTSVSKSLSSHKDRSLD